MKKEEKTISRKIEFKNKRFEIFLRAGADESVVAEIFNWQEYRAAEDVIKNSSLPILDVGAHIGIFSLYAKALNPAAKIYALEPEEANFNLLKKNIAANNLSDIKILKIALSGKTGERELAIESAGINHHLVDDPDENENMKLEKVRSFSLGDFLEKNNIPKIGLIKMDIEGGEYEIFENLSAEDLGKVKNIILEYHNYRGRNYKEIENILRKSGFDAQVFPSGFEKNLGFLLARNKRNSK